MGSSVGFAILCGMKHLRPVIVALGSLVSGSIFSAVPDLTSSLEFIDNPATNRWPANSYARGVLDLQFYRGRLFNGGGEVESNPGPTWIHSIDPYTNETRFEYSAGTEAIANYLVSSWGDLLSPSQDPHEGDATEGHIYQPCSIRADALKKNDALHNLAGAGF